jgi:8-oxo-dGTP diphosphatase
MVALPLSPESTPVAAHNVVCAALVRSGRILLCHRSPTRQWFPNVWDLPGGHIEPGESPRSALRREIAEEIGARVLIGRRSPNHVGVDPTLDLAISIWTVERWHGTVSNRQVEEHDEIEWFDPSELADLNLAHPTYPQLLPALIAP